MVKINIEKKYLILIGAVFVFLIGINLVVGDWGTDSSHGMWHEDEDIKISTDYSLGDIIGSDGKIHCDNIKGDVGDDSDFCNEGSSSSSSSSNPPIQIDLNSRFPSENDWKCKNKDLTDYCGDEDGCTIKFIGTVKSNDATLGATYELYAEHPDYSSNIASGLFGHTVSDGRDITHDRSWITGNAVPDWIWSFTYDGYMWAGMADFKSSVCSENSNEVHQDPFMFTFVGNPNINTRIFVYD